MKRIAIAMVGFLALAGVVGYGVTRRGSPGADDGGGVQAPWPAVGEEVAKEAAPDLLTEESQRATADAGGQGDGEVVSSLADIPGTPTVEAQIVKTGHLALVVAEGDFGQAFRRANDVAETFGGYVESSSTSGGDLSSGWLLIRIPSAGFNDAVNELRGLAQEVEAESVSGEDVTSQFVDLEARLRTWEAQESVLLRLMKGANSIEETLRVQRELQDVQLRIEQIRGQLRVMRDRTDLATIEVQMREDGAPVAGPREPSTRPSLAEAWERALDVVFGVAYVVVVGLGFLIPVSLLLAIVWLALRRLWSRRAVPAVA